MSDKERLEEFGIKDIDINTNEYLKHHGVLGMKWGIRRYQPYTGDKKGKFIGKKKLVNKFVNSKMGAKYKLHSDPKKELAEVEGKNPQKKTNNTKSRAALQKRYGALEDQMTYGKNENKEKNRQLRAQMDKIEAQLTGKKPKKESATKSMSDAELRQRINRLQMEKQYAQLTAKEKSVGKKMVNEILTNAAKQTATSYVSKAMSKGVDEIIKKANKAG